MAGTEWTVNEWVWLGVQALTVGAIAYERWHGKDRNVALAEAVIDAAEYLSECLRKNVLASHEDWTHRDAFPLMSDV